MADNLNYGQTFTPKDALGQKVDTMFEMARSRRRKFEQRWYDNNFFDDGHHFRYVSRQTGRVIDVSKRGSVDIPLRAIPKASRQIRGVANLLLTPDYTPVVYPEKVSRSNFMSSDAFGNDVFDEKTYTMARQIAKKTAQRTGNWLMEEWKEQELLDDKLVEMVLLAAKHGVSFMQIWPDAVDEKIRTEVFDAFDIVLLGNVKDIEHSPFVGKGVPRLLSEIMADERFDEEQRMTKLTPDNKYANSEIKQAYMQSKYGQGNDADEARTVIQKELFIKEYLTEENMEEIAKSNPDVLKDRQKGDMVMRHVFTAGGVWLLDEYVDLKSYPFVDFRFEPGPMYQTPFIERFIPQNKTLDMAVSRIERWMNSMVVGTWLVRSGENVQITNMPGGQKLEYDSTPPQQGNIQNLPSTVFNFIELLQGFIEEQGASTAALGQLPPGVKAGVAIESLKASEYANLDIPSSQLKKTVRRISEKMIEIASDYFISPQEVELLEKGEPSYFDIIGERGMEVRRKNGIEDKRAGNAVVIKKDMRVDIQVEAGLGFTEQGRRESIQQITEYMIKLTELGVMPPQAVQVVTKELFETFKFGATQEIMELLDDVQENGATMTEQQIEQMKVAIAEVLRDTGNGDPQQMVEAVKVGLMEALKDLNGGTNA